MQRNLTLWRPTTAVVLGLLASVAIAACGGSSPAGSSAGSAAKTGLKFAACVRAHGVPDYPDPLSSGAQTGTSGGGSTPPPGKVSIDGRVLSEPSQVVATAANECKKYSPDSQYGPRYSDAQLAQLQTAALAMSKCMRAHGLNYPDLTVGRGPGGHGFEVGFAAAVGATTASRVSRVNIRSPAFKAADIACSRLLNRSIPGNQG